MKKPRQSITAVILVGILSGCQDDGMLIAEVLPPGPAASASSSERSEQAAALEEKAVQDILRNNCASCHGPAANVPHGLPEESRNFTDLIEDIEDIDALIADGSIIPGVPEESRLMTSMTTGRMPPPVSGLPPVSKADLRQVERFILRLNPPTQREVEQILLRNCGSCHDEPAGRVVVLPVNDIGNIEMLVAAGLIFPGDRDRSPVYTRVRGGGMPPPNAGLPRVSERDLARLGGFIDLLP